MSYVPFVCFSQDVRDGFSTMDVKALKEKIEALDPKVHSSLLRLLTEECDRLTAAKGKTPEPSENPQDPFAELFEKTVDELNQRYIDGTTDHIETYHPDLYREIDEAENELNRVWRAGLEGKAGVEEFRAALGHWYRLHVRSIEIYTEQHKKEGE